MSPQIQKIMAFEKEIKEYEDLRRKYQTLIINKMDREEYIKYNEVLFSTHSCAIEGNSFSVDDTRELKEKGLGMILPERLFSRLSKCLTTSKPLST